MAIVLGRKPGGGGGSGGGVTSLAESGQPALTGAVTLSEGANVTLTQVGQDIEIAAAGSAALTYVQNALAADVAIVNSNTYYDGPSVTLAVGTWLLTGHVTIDGQGNPDTATAKLWDGTTVVASCQAKPVGGQEETFPLSGVVVIAAGTPTWKISLAANGGSGLILAACPYQGAGNNASILSAVKIA